MISGKSRYSPTRTRHVVPVCRIWPEPAIRPGSLRCQDSSTMANHGSHSPRKVLAAAASFLAAPAMSPATLTVTTNADSGPGSLRDAIAAASVGDTITFEMTGTITLTTGELRLTRNVTINGPGAHLLTISGNQTSRVLAVNSGVTASLSGLTVTGGNGAGAQLNGSGGGVLNRGTLTMTNCVITRKQSQWSGRRLPQLPWNADADGPARSRTTSRTRNNDAESSSGIDNTLGTLNVTNSTFSGNQANNCDSCGAAIWSHGTMTITDSTFTNNLGYRKQ